MHYYLLFIALIAISRVIELKLSKNHQQKTQAKVIKEGIYPIMVAFHTLWLIACVVEPLITHKFLTEAFLKPLESIATFNLGIFINSLKNTELNLNQNLTTTMIVLWFLAFMGRIWVLKTLKAAWNVHVVELKVGVVDSGPYKYIRHPNYVVVIAEIIAIPLIIGSYYTAIIGTIINALILFKRIGNEENTLLKNEEYRLKMAHKPRFIVKLF